MQIKPQWDAPSPSLGCLLSKKKKKRKKERKMKITSIGEDMEKLEHLCITGDNAKCSTAMKNSTSIKKIKHRSTMGSSNSTCGYIPKRLKSRDLNRHLFINIHGSIIHNSQKMETTKVSTDRWMDKQNVVYTYNGILFSLKKWNSYTCYNMDEPWRHYAKWNKPVKTGKYCMVPHIWST